MGEEAREAMALSKENVAKICHAANGALREILGEEPSPSWEDAPPEMRESGEKGIAFRIENPDATPERQHEKWMEHYIADGWIVGPVKDREKKEHPCLVPYSELPPEQRLKDAIYVAIVEACRPMVE